MGILLLAVILSPSQAVDVDRLAVQIALQFGASPQAEFDSTSPMYKSVSTRELIGALLSVSERRSASSAHFASQGGNVDNLTCGAIVALYKIHRRHPDARVVPYLRGVCLDEAREYEVRKEAVERLSWTPHPGLSTFYVEILRDHPRFANSVVSALKLSSEGVKVLPPFRELYTPEVRQALRGHLDRPKPEGAAARGHWESAQKLMVLLDRRAGYAEAPEVTPPVVSPPVDNDPARISSSPSPHSPRKTPIPEESRTPEPTSSTRRVAAFGALAAVLIVGILTVILRRRASA